MVQYWDVPGGDGIATQRHDAVGTLFSKRVPTASMYGQVRGGGRGFVANSCSNERHSVVNFGTQTVL